MIDWKEQTPFSGYLSRLPVAESVLVQILPGVLGLTSVDIRGRDSFIVRFKTHARSIWTMVPEKEWVGFLVPISWVGNYRLNGMSATSNSVFHLDGAHEYDVVAERRDAVTVGIRRSVLANAVTGLTGRQHSLEEGSHRKLEVPDRSRRRLLAIISKSISAASVVRPETGLRALPRTTEKDMIASVADWMIELQDVGSFKLTERRSDLKIVRAAIGAIIQDRPAALSVADLCYAIGVKKSRLYEAFSEIHSIAPGQYLYAHRLTSARELLLSGDHSSGSVKEVAIQHGFLSSGQFARAYRNMFGELPSETLAQQS